jgi:DNA-binding response OmpR family regulator
MATKQVQAMPGARRGEKQRSIMIVDDDHDLLQMAKRTLERKGFVVDARASAPRWDELQRVDPAVVFMDIELNGENGIEICQAIKTSERMSGLPVILISGHGEERLKDEASRCKADGFLSKPFSAKLLVDLADHYTK